ncbi:MAG: hypothetical protein US98_C0058G0009, partial [Parcubacteria group bacterium GW2011_GWC1_38_6]
IHIEIHWLDLMQTKMQFYPLEGL